MNYIYLVKVFNIKEGEFTPTLEEETVAACTDKNRAEEILKYNIAGVDDGCYNDVTLTVKKNYCFRLDF